MIKRFLHHAIAVESLGEAKELYGTLGMKEVERFECPEPKAKVLLMEDYQGTGVELWQFIDTSHRRVAEIDGHTAYETDAVEEDLAALLQKGFKQATPLSEDDTLRFVHVEAPDGKFIELAQYKR